MPAPKNPHDSMFRTVFGSPRQAAGLLRLVLPPEVIDVLLLDTLEVLDGVHISPELHPSASDLVLRVEWRRESGRTDPVYLVVAVEHQSTDDRFMPLRVLQYAVRIWERIRRENPELKRLPPVIPVVVHSGATPWRTSTNFVDLLDLPDTAPGRMLRRHLPDFALVLEDLAVEPTERLRTLPDDPIGATVLEIMKLARGAEAEGLFAGWMAALKPQAGESAHLSVLESVLWYLLHTCAIRPDTVSAAAEILPPETRTEMLTAAEQLIERGVLKGLEQGLQQGRQEGRQEGEKLALRALILRKWSARFGEPSAEVCARVDAATPDDLERWLEAVFAGERPEELVQ